MSSGAELEELTHELHVLAPVAGSICFETSLSTAMDTANTSRPEPARQVGVPGVAGYVDRIGVAPGRVVRFHVNAPAAYELSIARLGREAILDACSDDAADRADVELLTTSEHSSGTPQMLSPGSYVFVPGDPDSTRAVDARGVVAFVALAGYRCNSVGASA